MLADKTEPMVRIHPGALKNAHCRFTVWQDGLYIPGCNCEAGLRTPLKLQLEFSQKNIAIISARKQTIQFILIAVP